MYTHFVGLTVHLYWCKTLSFTALSFAQSAMCWPCFTSIASTHLYMRIWTPHYILHSHKNIIIKVHAGKSTQYAQPRIYLFLLQLHVNCGSLVIVYVLIMHARFQCDVLMC